MTLGFSQGVILYDVAVFAVIGVDFVAIRRHNDSVLAKVPAVLLAALLAAMMPAMSNRRVEFVLMGTTVLSAAIFGYANFLAFVKRGVTFSILTNHTRPVHSRMPDHEFIAIIERLHEMQGHGWVEPIDGKWTLTVSGRRVASVRRELLRRLRIEAVG